MSSDERVDRRIWWFTVSKAADRSSRMRTDNLESACAIRRASVTEKSAVSVEWPLLKPDCLASSLLFCERNNDTWLKTTCLSVFAMNGRREIGLKFSIIEVFNVFKVFWAVGLHCLIKLNVKVLFLLLLYWNHTEPWCQKCHVCVPLLIYPPQLLRLNFTYYRQRSTLPLWKSLS